MIELSEAEVMELQYILAEAEMDLIFLPQRSRRQDAQWQDCLARLRLIRKFLSNRLSGEA
jgi:hypothetical protein